MNLVDKAHVRAPQYRSSLALRRCQAQSFALPRKANAIDGTRPLIRSDGFATRCQIDVGVPGGRWSSRLVSGGMGLLSGEESIPSTVNGLLCRDVRNGLFQPLVGLLLAPNHGPCQAGLLQNRRRRQLEDGG